ncbi:hypothetical protein [Spirosoma spitsbergense]|jgi:hypothetical protein|uniref:hypothetical protein n=1 Tax=Spirosoma spitsbergense TaxID=431554 RepID=UPI00035FF8E0|nr:hypothetical protein [Spirosoma spitsbergense]
MKTTICTCLLCLIALVGHAQSKPTRIYIVKNGANTLAALQFYTTLNPDLLIKVKNNGYVLIETNADSLGVFKETSYSEEYQTPAKKQKPTFIKLEHGETYYFKVGPAIYNQHLDVEEMTERAFKLYIGLNDLTDNLKKYVLNSSKSDASGNPN